MRSCVLGLLVLCAGCVAGSARPIAPSVGVWAPAPLQPAPPSAPRGILAVRTLPNPVGGGGAEDCGAEGAPYRGYEVLHVDGRRLHRQDSAWSPTTELHLTPGEYVVVSETENPRPFSWGPAFAYVRVEIRDDAVTWVDFNGDSR